MAKRKPAPWEEHVHGPNCLHEHGEVHGQPSAVETYRRAEPKAGRNDPCPCGSGKKYKKCHGTGQM